MASRSVARLWGRDGARVWIRVKVRVRVGKMGGQVGASRQERLPVLDCLRLGYITSRVCDNDVAAQYQC